MTEVAVASILAMLTGAIPNAVAGASGGVAIVGSVMGKSPADVIDWKGATAPAMTGDAYARLGAAGAGLTALGDTRIANLDAQVSTRAPEAAGNVAAIKAKTDNLPASPASSRIGNDPDRRLRRSQECRSGYWR